MGVGSPHQEHLLITLLASTNSSSCPQSIPARVRAPWAGGRLAPIETADATALRRRQALGGSRGPFFLDVGPGRAVTAESTLRVQAGQQLCSPAYPRCCWEQRLPRAAPGSEECGFQGPSPSAAALAPGNGSGLGAPRLGLCPHRVSRARDPNASPATHSRVALGE